MKRVFLIVIIAAAIGAAFWFLSWGDSMLVVSTIPKDEIKAKVTEKLETVFSEIQEVRTGDFGPLQISPLRGECRTFEAAKDGKSIRGESVYLGDEAYSIAWQIITPPNSFDQIAGKYRELAGLIERVHESSTA